MSWRSGDDPGVAANQRLTAVAGAVLLALIVVELATVPDLGALLSVHVFVGVLMAGPLALKLGSTGWRFVRYHTGSPGFVRRGPPPPAPRVLAPLLIATTLAVIGSGIGLLVTGPTHPGPFVPLHVISVLAWLPMMATHVVAHIGQIPRLIATDWTRGGAEPAPGRRLRPGVTLGTLAAGGIAALLVGPVGAPWIAWVGTAGNAPGPKFIGAGLALAGLGIAAARPLRWR
jgi:hypothetical protein